MKAILRFRLKFLLPYESILLELVGKGVVLKDVLFKLNIDQKGGEFHLVVKVNTRLTLVCRCAQDRASRKCDALPVPHTAGTFVQEEGLAQIKFRHAKITFIIIPQGDAKELRAKRATIIKFFINGDGQDLSIFAGILMEPFSKNLDFISSPPNMSQVPYVGYRLQLVLIFD